MKKRRTRLTRVAADAKRGRIKLAVALLRAFESRDYVTAEEMEAICPACAEKMRTQRISKVKKAAAFRTADMTWEECIADAKKKGAKDPKALCGWLRWYGPGGKKSKAPTPTPKGYKPPGKG